MGEKIPAKEIGLPTTGAEVTGAQMVGVSGEGPKAIGAYCRVEAAIHPVDRSAPDIRMQVGLPAQWNGRAMMFGGGAFDGVILDIAANVPFGPADQPTPEPRPRRSSI
ncbi:tannase/feruloyl esterase family alpha/beta hydrolase [Streptomyces sp. AK02-04a]|uniref:tannase/feruloyl esterase family alpha/beta hydrolase n=1 Tax=Streptomyces sp. AK02-04a TaxID=3028649 RepID=UPI0029AF68B8|nr:tannase/feruloyl esterase family alpha/beta hydrolase [Streptomyces sp. AK02-04a]MDX3763868.1 tannase/feruloyl esterase family alpha/beta hydrolase [Streptomyces sp. AK02-04a]